GMAAVAVTFARYAVELSGVPVLPAALAVITLLILTVINCLGVRSGSNTQTVLMLLKLAAIGMLIVFGFQVENRQSCLFCGPIGQTGLSVLHFGAAMTPVMFAYGGWQTASFISGELKRPKRDLVIGLLAGVIGVIGVYIGVNLIC